MKKAEMEHHHAEYHSKLGKARAAKQRGLYREAIQLVLSSWGHIDGMLRYERKYGGAELATIEAIDMVFEYAPFLLDLQSLERLESLLKNHRRIDKDTSESMVDKLAKARALMWDAHRMWNHLEGHPDARDDELAQALDGAETQWRPIAETWEKMGLLDRTPDGSSNRWALSTRLGQVVSAKCPSCGGVAEGPKAMFFEELSCPECHVVVSFVILARESAGGRQE